MNKVVARLVDGRILKGTTTDFSPGKDLFHLSVANTPAGGKPVILHTKEMKALFFVKDFSGDPQHVERNAFDASRPTVGRRIQVVFKDGSLVGTTTGYQPGRPGFCTGGCGLQHRPLLCRRRVHPRNQFSIVSVRRTK